MTNTQVAELLRAVAAAYQLKGEEKNRFRIIAYQRAADAVEHASSELKDLWDEGKLDEVPGIGIGIAQHLGELFKTGKSKHFEEVMKGFPKQMFDLMIIPGIGAKTAYKLVEKFKSKISEKNAIADLERIAKGGRIAKLEGFGEDSEKDILRSISEVKGRSKRILLPYALQVAKEILEWLNKSNEVLRAEPLGSLRRKASTVGDIDIAVSTNNPKVVIEHFVKFPKTQRILEKGVRTASIVIPGDIQVDVMVETPEGFGALLQHFTGSKHHNIALREYALKKNLSLSDYGIYIKKDGKKILKKIATEEDFYKFLRMDWIPPELREDSGEIKAALNNSLPRLIELKDIKADLQIHSSFDIETSHDLGLSSMKEVASKALGLGYEYIAFTEHNPSHSRHSERQILDILKRKRENVDKINYSLSNNANKRVIRLFNSLEIDILPTGKLPVTDAGMQTLDFALVSVHSSFRITKKLMTERVLSALSHPKVKIFAHPTARKLEQREGIELDWVKIFDLCRKEDKWLEINADPMRLDLPDFMVREAVIKGIKLTLGTDAHHVDHMDNMTFGVSVARRGWATKGDIVNSRSLIEFERMIES
ncbi:hypothetical protein A2863_01525 [Candidatus Woesebacteria bacterium RIFCSPHIGHO2_01_FULL_38_9b]|uniref:DNA-directed DNA polymerase X domain-containing protein n=1 Tax=Candidatus Woesebacteria bacterium RIFCSPHIGHO2_01_FULL_38_9b TaxID=1802493 RepID=A0A1F7XZ17_9BACT|nr:MAG: hypothetical protein A2863_01525 [Candidatus Woesebacteria bacterium RIFCSPHIGHO2_01_FULL_38_9b]